MQQGTYQQACTTARAMLRCGYSISEIADLVGLKQQDIAVLTEEESTM